MNDFYYDIFEIVNKNPEVLFGISNINFSEYKSKYKCALVYAVPHSELISINNYQEKKFESILCKAYEHRNLLLQMIIDVLKNHNIDYCIPPVAQSSEETLIVPFSYKFACVNAGLGWIGKNDVLVTEKYGPRVVLSAVLIDHDLPIGKAVTKSKCPPECKMCVDACPHNALSGDQWDIDKKREEIIDFQLCNQKRSEYIKLHNRKHSCGFCIVSCPIGI